MLWNEPNNTSHWDFGVDPGWEVFAEMVRQAGQAVHAEAPSVKRVLGGISPVDPRFVARMGRQGALQHVDVVAVHGFPLDWNLWGVDEWPERLDAVRAVTDLPVWVTEVGVSTFASESLQVEGLRRTAEILIGRAERIHWYSLFDLPGAWDALTRHRRAEGTSYLRHYHMGLVREDGTPKPALRAFADYAQELGICQWVHWQDPRLDDMVRRLRDLGVRKVRTGLSWSDDHKPGALAWFDRQMNALEEFDLTVTFCFTPDHAGVVPHYTSPPRNVSEFADFCARMTRRYAS
ncbi:MAG: hypothetical protein JWM27_607 [Gemmatimonadetes bacterium]|nr:hypothetical protein [Gemmatimonadota bacterium]